ncbi:MAG: virulence RhuM family protein [Chitinivibrionia bacterium]|nr:virulence RhuM family protein [Chitinivibrionia bacterium]
MNKGEIILYQPDDSLKLEVQLEDETVWLSLDQISALFQRDKSTVSRHVKNVFEEGELDKVSVVAKFATTAADGKTYQVDYYNLDVIISVGYRVKSLRGTQFRRWANQILKDYLLKGYVLNQRIDRLERKMVEHDQKFELLINTSTPPKEGALFEGQIFDAYILAADMIKSANKTIVLLDNYPDETTLLILSKRKENVSAQIYTKQISAQLKLDLAKHNSQYAPIKISKSTGFHDRFLVLDGVVYHIGASLKDLGKSLFAFSRMEITESELLKNI